MEVDKQMTNKETCHVRGVVVITTAQLHSTKPELRFCAGSNPARGPGPWSRLEIRLNAIRRSTIPQKQFIIITMPCESGSVLTICAIGHLLLPVSSFSDTTSPTWKFLLLIFHFCHVWRL